MNWEILIKRLRAEGYTGEDALEAVRTFVREKYEAISVNGKTVDLDELWKSRKAKADLDLTEQAIDERVNARVDAALKTVGLDKDQADKDAKAESEVETKALHNVKVGADRLGSDPKGGYKFAGEFYRDVIVACSVGSMPARLNAWTKAALTTFGQEDIGADGGFAVPEEFRNAIVSRINGEGSLLSRCDQTPISGVSMSFPEDEDTPWNDSSGIRAFWEGEAAAHTQTKPVLKRKTLRLRKLVALVPLTDELLEDAPAMQAYVNRKAPEKLGFKLDEAIVRGSGAGQPLGYMNSPALVSVARTGGGLSVELADIVNVYSRMYAPWRTNAVWIVHPDVEPLLMQMTLGNWPIYIPAGSLAGRPNAMLLGNPLITSQHAVTAGTIGDVMYVALDQYAVIVKRTGLEAATSMHLWFDQDTMALKFRLRVDGQPWLSAPITQRSGANTQSAFVTIAT